MKKINLISRLLSYSHEKQKPQRFGRYAAMLIMLLTLGVGQMWADVHLYEGHIKLSFNGSAWNSGNYYKMYSGGPNNSVGTAPNLGTLTGDLKITDFKMKINTNYSTNRSKHTLWYNIDGSGGGNYTINWGSSSGDGYPEKNGWNNTVISASNSSSGDHSLNIGFYSDFWWGSGENDKESRQELKVYYFSYKVLPPDVSDFTVTPSGDILSGTGSSDDPFIISYNGSLTLTSSGGTQAHSDGNSSIQFSKDNSSWGTGSSNYTKTESSITTTDKTAINVYARYYNSASCIGNVKTKTYYYKTAPWSLAGTMTDPTWNTNVNMFHHYGKNASSKDTCYLTITLPANTDYLFKIKNRTNSNWYGKSSTTLTYASHNKSAQTFSTDGDNCTIRTAGKGSYKFIWNSTDHKLTVIYPTSYTVTFGYGDHGSTVTASGSTSGTIASGKYVSSGENVTFTETHESGYSLKGWYTTADGNTAVSTMSASDNELNSISGDKTVYAQYSEIMRTVTVAYKCSGLSIHANGSVANVGVATSQSVTALDIEGYTFSTWSAMPSGVSTSSSLTSSTITINASAASQTITANYTLNSHTLTWNLDGGTVVTAGTGAAVDATGTPSTSVNYGASITAPVPQKDGYTFTGWNTTPATTMPDNDLTYTAQWTEITHTVTVKYKYGDEEIADDGEVTGVGITTAQEVTAPTPIGGYSFTTWSAMPSGVTKASGELTDATISINATADGQTIVANYEPATYNGTLEGVDGSDGTYSVVYGETSLTVTSAPARSGYHVYRYYLTYDEGEYSNYIAESSETTSKALRPNVSISSTDYTDANGKWIYTVSAPTIYVKWEANTYDITLTASLPGDATGNTGTDKITATMGSATFSPNVAGRTMPSENGYNFLGYFTDEDEGDDVQVLNANGTNVINTKYINADAQWDWAADIEVFGHWSPKTYTVTLNDEGADSGKEGTGSVTATFDASTNLTSAITQPQKTAYTFGGYYTEQGGSGSRLIDENGAWIKDVTGYTGHDGDNPKWKYYTASTLNLYAKWTQTITLNQNSATVEGTDGLAATYNGALSTGGITNPKKIGYAFAGWATAASEGSVVIEPDGTVNTVTNYTDGSGNWVHAGASTLYAKWTSDVNNFKADAATTDWNTSTNWSKGEVPTDDYSTINILGNVVMSSGTSAFVGAVTIDGGSLTINAGAVLEVAGTVTNSDASKLVIKSNSTAQGALIFDNSASAKATVDIYTKLDTYDSYQVIAIPVTTTGVSESFAGSGVYTYVWNEGDGWERRGYYNDLDAFEAIALMQTASHTYTVSGTLASTDDFSETLAYTTGTYQGTNVFGNSWTAPIKIKEIEIPAEKAEQTVYVLENGNWVAYTLGSVANEVVPAMQAYAIIATATGGTVSIDYDDAVRGAASHNDALRAPQRSTSEDQVQMALAISDGERQTALRLHEDALLFTEDFDNGWEARFLEGDGLSGQLYVQKENQMVVLAEPDLEGTVVGLIPGVASSYTISFEGDGAGYYLNDMVTEQSTLIAEGNTYMFTSDDNTNATRFVISRMPINKVPTGVESISCQPSAVRKQMIDGILYIIHDGRIYSAQGALVK